MPCPPSFDSFSSRISASPTILLGNFYLAPSERFAASVSQRSTLYTQVSLSSSKRRAARSFPHIVHTPAKTLSECRDSFAQQTKDFFEMRCLISHKRTQTLHCNNNNTQICCLTKVNQAILKHKEGHKSSAQIERHKFLMPCSALNPTNITNTFTTRVFSKATPCAIVN